MASYRAALLNPDGECVNVILVDDSAEWSPPEGFTIQKLKKDEPCEFAPLSEPETRKPLAERLNLTPEDIEELRSLVVES